MSDLEKHQDESHSGTEGESLQMEPSRVASIIESLLLVSTSPLRLEKITVILNQVDRRTLSRAIEILKEKYGGDSGVLIECVSGGYQLRTNPANQEYVRRFLQTKPPRLSRAAMETLAVIAYKQPVTRAEIEDIRGVDSQGAIKTLLERRLIRVVGKKEVPGRPFLFGTTKEFLEVFGLESLESLPSLEEIAEILGHEGEGEES